MCGAQSYFNSCLFGGCDNWDLFLITVTLTVILFQLCSASHSGSVLTATPGSSPPYSYSIDVSSYLGPSPTIFSVVATTEAQYFPSGFNSSNTYSPTIQVTCPAKVAAPTFSCTLSAPATKPENTDFTLTATVKGTGTGTLAVYDGTGSIDRTVPFSSPGSQSWTVTVKDSGVDGITGQFTPSDPDLSTIFCFTNITITAPQVPVFACQLSAPSSAAAGANFSLVITVTGSGDGTVQVYDPTGSINKTASLVSPGSDYWNPSISVVGEDTITGQFTPTNPQAITAYCSANIKITGGPPSTFSCTMSAPSSAQVNKGFTVSYTVSGSGTGGGTFSMYGPDTNVYSKSITSPYSGSGDLASTATGTETITGQFSPSGSSSSDAYCSTNINITSGPPPTFSCTMSAPSSAQVNKGFTVSYTVSGSGTDGGTFSMYGPDTNFYSKGITSPATYPYYGSGDMSVSSTGTETITGEFAHQARPHHPPIARQILKLLPGVSQFLVVLYRRLLQR